MIQSIYVLKTVNFDNKNVTISQKSSTKVSRIISMVVLDKNVIDEVEMFYLLVIIHLS